MQRETGSEQPSLRALPTVSKTSRSSGTLAKPPKLRLVFYEDENGIQSYFHLERTECLRVIAILKILPEFKNWIPISVIAKKIEAKVPATLWTIQKLAGALWIDIKVDGKRRVIAKHPILLVRKEQYNTRNNLKKQKYLRATAYVKNIIQ